MSEYSTIKQLFFESTYKFNNKIYCIEDNGEITYEQLRNDVCRFIPFFAALKGDQAAIWARPGYRSNLALFSAILAGKVPVLIDSSLEWKDALPLMKRADVQTVLCDSVRLGRIPAEADGIEAISLDIYRNSLPCNADEVEARDCRKAAMLLYTSGTTGTPKGVVLSGKSILNNAAFSIAVLGDAGDLIVSFLPNHHILYFDEMFYGLVTGSTMYYSRDIRFFGNDLVSYHPTRVFVVPVVVQGLYEEAAKQAAACSCEISEKLKELTGGKLNHIEVGSAPVDHRMMFDFAKAGITFDEGYGLTETGGKVVASCLEPEKLNYAMKGFVGNLVEQHDIRIADDGEILVRNADLFLGYYKDPAATGEAITDGWIRTGDIGYISGNGLYLTGRKKNLIILSNGENVSPEEIEKQLQKSIYIDEVIVKDEADSICAEIYSSGINEQDYDRLSAGIAEAVEAYNREVPAYKRIQKTRIRRHPFVRNNIGKIVRDETAGQDEYYDGKREYILPATDTEVFVCSMFSEILKLEKTGATDDFFALGGNSLRAAGLINRIEERTGKRLEINDIFKLPTPRQLSEYIDSADWGSYCPIPVAVEKSCYEASPAQKRMFLLWKLDREGTAYNNPVFFRSSAGIDIGRLKAAFGQMITRHEILRTRYFTRDNGIYQQIIAADEIVPDFSVYGYEADGEVKPEALVVPFDLEEGRVLRFAVIKCGSDTVFMLDIHHIAADGMSIMRFLKELSEIYNGGAAVSGLRQYKDYSEWQRGRDLSRQAAFWREQFRDEIPVPDMPTDYKRPAEQSFRGAETVRTLDRGLCGRLHEMAEAAGATDYMVLLSAAMVLLGSYSRQEDIVIGSPVSGRIHRDTERMQGMFVNTLAMRGKPEGGKRYSDFLQEVRQSCLSALENQDYPFEELVEQIGVKRDMSRNPLFDVMLILQNNEQPEICFEGAGIELLEQEHRTSKVDLTFEIRNTGGEYRIGLEYCTDLYSRESAERLLRHYETVLRQIAEAPDMKLSEIGTADSDEQKLILDVFNATAQDYQKDRTVVELFEERAKKSPDTTAVVYHGSKLTYMGLNIWAEEIGRRLRWAGIKPNDLVAIFAQRSLEMIAGIYGVLKAGGAYLPIDPDYPEDRVRYMLEDSSAKAVLYFGTDIESIRRKGNGTFIPVMDLGSDEVWEGVPVFLRNNWLEHVNCPEDTAYCIYTSGTTGKPKGVLVKNSNVVNYSAEGRFGVMHTAVQKGYTRMAAVTNITFDIHVTEILCTLMNGMTVYLADRDEQENSEAFEKLVMENDIQILQTTPSRMKLYMMDDRHQGYLKNLKFILLGGERVEADIVGQLRRHSDAVLENVYGPSETTVWSTAGVIDNEIQDEISIGRPVTNTRVYIMEQGKLCGIGVPGELCIAGDGVTKGYLNRPELTAERFVKDMFGEGCMYRTGDLARWLPDGRLEYRGRLDEQVKIRGHRIEPGEIAGQIRSFDGIRDCAVIVREDACGEKAICAYIIGDGKTDIPELRRRLAEVLPGYMVPAYMMQIETIPVTKNGKLDRRALPEITAEGTDNYCAPENETEELLCSFFSEILGVKRVGTGDSFFELGGHSLKATRLLNHIEEKTDVKLSLKEVFSHPTPKQLAELVNQGRAEKYQPIPKAGEKAYYPLSPAQRRMYLLWQMDREGTVYNMPALFKLTGEVRPEAVEAALRELKTRNEILRTAFVEIDGEPVQKIISAEDAETDFCFLEAEAGSERELAEKFIRPFRLEKGDAFRAELVKRKDCWLLLLDMHHIISDGMSISLFMKAFSEIYNSGAGKQKAASSVCQYKDYSEWLGNRDLSSQASFWKEQFQDEIPVLDMPVDFPRPSEQSFRGAETARVLDRRLSDRIRETAQRAGATEYMVLLSAAMVLLGKYSRQEDIVIGSPISGRTHRDTEDMLGIFINTLPMRGRPERNKSFSAFLQEVKESCLKAYGNQEYPFEELVEALDVRRDFSRNPLFDVMLVLQNNEQEKICLNGAEAEYIETGSIISKFDLTFEIRNIDGEYHIRLEYCTDLFRRESAERILEHYEAVLAQAADNTDCAIADIEMVGEEERKLILETFNATGMEYPGDKTIDELFRAQVRKTPDATAVVYKSSGLTYRELDERVSALAVKLRSVGVGPDDLVAVIADRGLEMLAGIFGIIRSGGAYVPIDPTYPAERISFMLGDSAAKAVLLYLEEGSEFSEIEINKNIPVIDLGQRSVWEDMDEKRDADSAENGQDNGHADLANVNRPSDLLYCIYTSGTTGTPKGVLIEHYGVCNLAEFYIREHGVCEKDKVLMFANYVFDASVTEIMMGLLSGAELHIASAELRMDTQGLEEYISSNGITVALLPPVILSQMKNISGPRVVITAGSEANRQLVEKCKDIPVYSNDYGPTEGTVCATFWKHGRGQEIPERIPIGRPVSNKRIYIADGNTLCGIGVPGELCIAGEGLARGYLNRPELTAEKFTADPFTAGKMSDTEPSGGRMYRTGDLARWLPDGNIEYLGRIDGQVKIRGFRVEPGEIESRLRSISGIRDCAVMARQDEAGVKSIHAFLVADGDEGTDSAVFDQDNRLIISEIRNILSESLPDYMIPSYMMQIDSIPVTKNGKPDYRSLPDIKINTAGVVRRAATEEEAVICRAFEEILKISQAGAGDSFFELGGDSIKAIRVVSRIKEAGYSVTVKDIMGRKTPERIAERLTRTQTAASHGQVSGEVLLTPIMKWFTSLKLKEENYFNQACMLSSSSFDRTALLDSLNALVLQHDMLRARFSGGRLIIAEPDGAKQFDFEEFRIAAEDRDRIADLCSRIQAGMDLDRGPLMKAVLFHTPGQELLMLAIHHLAVDGVSWRIIIEDLKTAYSQRMAGEEIRLPRKTAPFPEWAGLLYEYSETAQLQDERAYWTEVSGRLSGGSIAEQKNAPFCLKRITAEIDRETAEKLVYEAGKAYGTEINDLLLSSLALALYRVTGQKQVAVQLEGHGRESLHRELETDRTVGWFTSIYPVLLEIKKDDSETVIVETKEMLRKIPNHGIGFGILRYLTEEIASVLPDIGFNYLGELEDDHQGESGISLSDYPCGESIGTENRIPPSIAFNGYLKNGIITFNISYDAGRYEDSFIREVGRQFTDAAGELAEHCTGRSEQTQTASDFGLTEWDTEDFNDLLDQFSLLDR